MAWQEAANDKTTSPSDCSEGLWGRAGAILGALAKPHSEARDG